MSRLNKMLIGLVFATFTVSCAAQQFIRQGDKLLNEGKYTDAVVKYEEALRVSPNNKQATERIKKARRGAVRDVLTDADKALSTGSFAEALKLAQRARRMPLDLDDVDLVRRIDDTITRAARLAEEKVAGYIEAGHFVPALELAEQVTEASPGVVSRQQWAAEVQQKAQGYYSKNATDLEAAGLPGSAALQLAMAKRVGVAVDGGKVQELWNRFAEPTCFAEPQVSVRDDSGQAADFVAKLEAAARNELEALRQKCGEGTRPLGVNVVIEKLETVDKSDKQRAAKPLPGVKIETEETYYEEETYTAVEQVTDYETRKELQEKRDCAPRPGKERGCRTWTEEVEVKVPVTREKEVQKTRKVKKTRPVQGDLPADKVVTYEVTTVQRKVTVVGAIEVVGAPAGKKAFTIVEESKDSSHDEARHPKLVVPADPQEALPLGKVLADATVAVSREVGKQVSAAAQAWSKDYAQKAAEQALAGQMPQAEELYLKLMALGGGESDVGSFFKKRYGKEDEHVMGLLASALGRESEASEAVAQGASRGFPKRLPKQRVDEPAPAPAPAPEVAAPAPTVEGPKKVQTSMSDDELKALEEESIDATKAPAAPAAPAAPLDPNAPQPAPTSEEEQQEQAPTEEGSTPAAPKRGPIKPK